MKPLILVLGPGCSGTSKICNVLYKRHKVCFCHDRTPQGTDSRGGRFYHESKVMKHATKELLNGGRAKRWRQSLESAHAGCKAPFWGVKNLDLAFLKQSHLNAIRPSLVIETRRSRPSCLRSWRRYDKTSSAEEISRRYDEAVGSIMRLDWDPWVSIEMDPERGLRPDAELENFSDGWIRMLHKGMRIL